MKSRERDRKLTVLRKTLGLQKRQLGFSVLMTIQEKSSVNLARRLLLGEK